MTDSVIGILKMPIGNLQSAWNALYELGFDPLWIDQTSSFDELTHLIVPGVGHFGAVMGHLEAAGFPSRIREFAASGRPVLGICVGMQLLADIGTEGGETPGLGLVRGMVKKLPNGDGLRLPHVGWSSVAFRHDHPVFDGIKSERDFYFVHSYAMNVDNPDDCLGETTYGAGFTSIVGHDNVLGFQFHPEKSQVNGLKLLENFCNWDGRC
jgi:glutamine amidotransferase